jgi:hypothetical protein
MRPRWQCSPRNTPFTLFHTMAQPKLTRTELKADQLILSESPERPSDGWQPVNGYMKEKIDKIISTGNWTYLCSEALKKQYAGAPAVTCTIDHTRLARGMQNVVFEIAFSDSSYWVVKIRLFEEQKIETEMLSEIATCD